MGFSLRPAPFFPPALLFLFFFILIPGLSFAQGKVKGKVTDSTGRPIAYVNVNFPELERGVNTNDSGSFKVEGLPQGKQRVLFSKVGYRDVEREVRVPEKGFGSLHVRMETKGIEFGAISIAASRTKEASVHDTLHIAEWVGRKKEEASSASLGATVKGEAGVDMIGTGGGFGKPVIQGMSGKRIRVLHDGVPMEYQQFGVRHAPNVDPFLSEKLQIIQAPSTIIYGSSASGGVVNVHSPRPPISEDSSWAIEGKAMGAYRSNDGRWSSGALLGLGNGKLGIKAGLIARSGGNIRTPDVETYGESGEKGDPKFSGELPHTDMDRGAALIGIAYRGEGWGLKGNYSAWKNEHNFLLPSGEGLGQSLQNRIIDLKGNVRLHPQWKLEGSWTHLLNHRRSGKAGQTRDELPQKGKAHLDIELEEQVYRALLAHSSIKGLRGKGGLEYLQIDQKSQGAGEALVPSGITRNYAVFLFERYRYKKWSFFLGGRYDHRSQKAEPDEGLKLPDPQKGEDEGVLERRYSAPSGAFGLSRFFSDRWRLSMHIGRGFRAPDLFELHAEGVHGGVAAHQRGNPFLKAEYSLKTDLQIAYRSEKVKGEATLYRNAIKGYIHKRNIGTPSGWNGPPIMKLDQGRAVLNGGQIAGRVRLWKGLMLKSSFQIVRGRNKSRAEELPLMPPTRLGGELRYRWEHKKGFLKRVTAYSGARYTFAKEAAGRFEPFWQFGNLPNFGYGVASTDPYTLFHAGIAMDLQLWKGKPVRFSVQGNNLTDRAYRDFLDTYKGYALGMGRNIKFKLTLPFGKDSSNG